MKKIIFIFCILNYLNGYGQRYDHLNIFDGRSDSYQNQFIRDEKNLYSLLNVYRDSAYLNNTFIANVEKTNYNNMVLTKFENNKAVKHIHFGSYETFGRIHLVNDKIWVTGSRQGDFWIDGELKYPSAPIPDGSVRDYFRGFILIYDKNLNLERDIMLGAGEYVKVVEYHNGKYYIAGNYGLRSTTMTVDDVTISDPNNSKNEIFLFTLNDTNYEAESGISFGGPGREGLDRMHIDKEGNMILMGSTWSGGFYYKNNVFPTQGNFALSSFFLIKIDRRGEPVYFHSFDTGEGADAPDNRAPDLTVDEDGNLYIGTFGRVDKFKFDGQILHQSTNNKVLLVFMCLSKNGNLRWTKNFESSSPAGSIFNKSNILYDEIVFWGYSNQTKLIYEGDIFQPNDTIQVAGVIKLDKNTGAFRSYQDIVAGFGSRLSDMEPLPNGNYMTWLTWYGHSGDAKGEPFFENKKKPNSSFIFEFNPEIPQLVSTLDEVAIDSFTEINIFPNPIQKESKLSIRANEPIKAIELYDINGRLIERISAVEETTTINSNQLPGTYILKFQMESQGSVYKKLIIQ